MNRPIHQSINRFKQSISLSIAHSLARIHTSFSSQRPLISTRSLARSLARSLISVNPAGCHSVARSLAPSLAHSHTRSFARSAAQFTRSFSRSLAHFPCSSAFHPLTRSRFSTLLRSRPRSHFLNIFSRGEISPPGMKIYYYLITGMESDSGLHGKGPRKALVRSLGGQGGCGCLLYTSPSPRD